MDTTDDLLSIAEAAKRLGVGKYTIRRLIRSGALPAFRIRTVLRISPFDLRRYLRAHPAAQTDHLDDDRTQRPQPSESAK